MKYKRHGLTVGIRARIPDSEFTIYALVDPRNEAFFYIGRTRNPLGRLRRHMLAPDDKYKGKKVRDYLVAMKAAGVQPVMVILERTSDRLREYVWIDYFRGQGVMLTNSAGNRGVRQIAGLPPRPRTIRAASGFLGVSQKGSKWRWGVMVKGVHQRGTCNTAIEAALARDAAVVALRGIGATTNASLGLLGTGVNSGTPQSITESQKSEVGSQKSECTTY